MRLETLLTHPAVQALGRSLLHFLWQGSLLALPLWVVKIIAPAAAARVRYAAASFLMLAMPVALVITVAQDLRSESAFASVPNPASLDAPNPPSVHSAGSVLAAVSA